jgi:hypothetical protein
MKPLLILLLIIALFCFIACDKAGPATAPTSTSKLADQVQQKLVEYAGSSATNCGRLDTHATADQSNTASDCALVASQSKRAFYVAYDMPGMTVGVAGNSAGKLFTVQSHGAAPSSSFTSGDCPSQLRVAASGRVTCFAPGDMGSMGGGHTAVPPGMPNPHAMPKAASQ